jgi:hypothetical protein
MINANAAESIKMMPPAASLSRNSVTDVESRWGRLIKAPEVLNWRARS